MDYLDCKGLSEAAEISSRGLGLLFLAGLRLDGADLAPAFYELLRRRSRQLVAFDWAAAIYLASLSNNSWPGPHGAARPAFQRKEISDVETQQILSKGLG